MNEASFFRSHRWPLAAEALARGDDVVVVCGAGTGEETLASDVRCRVVPLSRSGFHPWREWLSYRAIRRLYREESPDIVHHVTIKPVIYGTHIATALSVPAVVNAVPGLGYVYTQRGLTARIRRVAVDLLYRVSLRHPNMRLIFQNREDLDAFVNRLRVAEDRVCLIRGAGVDLDRFHFAAEPVAPISIVLMARMLKDKGVREFVAAARIVHRTHPDWRFVLAGGLDPGNPSALSAPELDAWQREGEVSWLGHCEDVVGLLGSHHIACLPSYREGLPKSLLEAAAAGRVIVTTNVPGCREVVCDNVTGLLVEARNPQNLAKAIIRLGEDPVLRDRLRRAARDKAERCFGVEHIVRETFAVYDELTQL